MKKLILCALVLLLAFGTVSCSKDELVISADKISENTFIAKSNGELQVATVEDFDKSYYNLDELKDFIKEQINSYNKKAGDEMIAVDDIQNRDGKAVMVLTYNGMEPYATFNEVYGAYFKGGFEGASQLNLPATMINAKNNSLSSTEEILKNDKYKILVLTEPYSILVDGKVKYYSDNAKLLEDNKLQGAAEGMTVVVFK